MPASACPQNPGENHLLVPSRLQGVNDAVRPGAWSASARALLCRLRGEG